MKISADDKINLMSELVFAALSVPLSNKQTKNERISSDYLPKDIVDEVELSQTVGQEIFKVAQMLQIQGIPSRHSLIA